MFFYSIDPTQKPAIIIYCCYVRQAMPHIMFSRGEKYTTEQKRKLTMFRQDRQDRAGYFWYETRSQLSNVVSF